MFGPGQPPGRNVERIVILGSAITGLCWWLVGTIVIEWMLLMSLVHKLHRSITHKSVTWSVVLVFVSWVSSWILLRWTLQHLPRILSLRVALDVPTIKSAAVAVLFALSGYAIWELAMYLSEVIVF